MNSDSVYNTTEVHATKAGCDFSARALITSDLFKVTDSFRKKTAVLCVASKLAMPLLWLCLGLFSLVGQN